MSAPAQNPDPLQSRKWKALADAKQALDRFLVMAWSVSSAVLIAKLIPSQTWADVVIWSGGVWAAGRAGVLAVYTGGNVAQDWVIAKHSQKDGE